MSSFVSQLSQRRVYRVAIGYAVAAWLAVQIAATVLPAFHAPEFILPVLIVLLGVGFPVALVLAWAFDITPGGIQKTAEGNTALTAKNSRYVAMLAAIGVLIATIGVGAYWFWHSPSRNRLLVAGNPARFLGWVCTCGERLPQGPAEGLLCACGLRWRIGPEGPSPA